MIYLIRLLDGHVNQIIGYTKDIHIAEVYKEKHNKEAHETWNGILCVVQPVKELPV